MRTAGTQGEGRTQGPDSSMGAPRDVSAGTDPGAKVRGAGLSPRRKGWEGLCRPKCKELFSQEVAWVKQARQEPHSRDWVKG